MSIGNVDFEISDSKGVFPNQGVLRRTQKGISWEYGGTVIADGAVGYETGCLFQKNDGAGPYLFVNEGTLASANFDAVNVT